MGHKAHKPHDTYNQLGTAMQGPMILFSFSDTEGNKGLCRHGELATCRHGVIPNNRPRLPPIMPEITHLPSSLAKEKPIYKPSCMDVHHIYAAKKNQKIFDSHGELEPTFASAAAAAALVVCQKQNGRGKENKYSFVGGGKPKLAAGERRRIRPRYAIAGTGIQEKVTATGSEAQVDFLLLLVVAIVSDRPIDVTWLTETCRGLLFTLGLLWESAAPNVNPQASISSRRSKMR